MSDLGNEFVNFGQVLPQPDDTGEGDSSLSFVVAWNAVMSMVNPATLYFPPGKYLITGLGLSTAGIVPTPAGVSVDFPPSVTLKFANGAKLLFNLPAAGTVVPDSQMIQMTIEGAIDAGLWQIFDTSGGGTVVLNSTQITAVYPEWWGANSAPLVGEFSFDSSPAIQSAFDAAYNNLADPASGQAAQPIPVVLSSTYDLRGPLSISAAPGTTSSAVLRGVQGIATRGTGIPALTAVWKKWPVYRAPNLLEVVGDVHLVVEHVGFTVNLSSSGPNVHAYAGVGGSSLSMGGYLAQTYLTPVPEEPYAPWGATTLVAFTFGSKGSTCEFRRCSFLYACYGPLLSMTAPVDQQARRVDFHDCSFEVGTLMAQQGILMDVGDGFLLTATNCVFVGGGGGPAANEGSSGQHYRADLGGGGALAMICAYGGQINLRGCCFQNVRDPSITPENDGVIPNGADVCLWIQGSDRAAAGLCVTHCESQSYRFLERIFASENFAVDRVPPNVVLLGLSHLAADPGSAISSALPVVYNSILWNGPPSPYDGGLILIGCKFQGSIEIGPMVMLDLLDVGSIFPTFDNPTTDPPYSQPRVKRTWLPV